MIKVGLTGGIGSGKSVVAHIFRVKSIPVYIADTESKKLTESNPQIREGLINLFGSEVYQNGKLNKPLLAGYIFNDKTLLAKVNEIIHPVVLADFLDWANRQKSDIVIIESAILFESGFNKKTDLALMVYAPVDIRIQRTIERDNLPEEEIRKRINNQMTDEKKCELADYIIINTDSKALIPQVEDFINSIYTKKIPHR